MTPEELMRQAADLAVDNVARGGGPFGAVIVKGGEIIARGVNRVTAQLDPTAHAEVNAIREACQRLGTFDLSGCEIYTSCEPCPMCLGAIYWARLERVYYACTQADAAAIDFDDQFIYQELDRPKHARRLPMTELGREDALRAFRAWSEKVDKTPY
ncbi:tRNA(Arg) A34 adenosine deaminase TadA [Deinobacterium chartae]|uniref:tRNA(Arg) A34 adenosine deaminase TadA n=1 Tax=Deinobacterium chartae TaxID=521158 RepID=A0A841HXA8_9DEIO|nr:nucleoside deaminase [Deinobacterium chartae]MBB6096840.1 tRNA(Arg) A34 adenosine deaminase TadA [Deinobacterium chartae]